MLSKYRSLPLIGIIVTIILTLISEFVLNLDPEISWLTFIVGSTITLTTALLEYNIIDAFVGKVDRAAKIYHLLAENDPWITEQVDMILTRWIKLQSIPPLFTTLAKKYTLEFEDQLREIASGKFTLEEPDYSKLETIITNASETVKATVLPGAIQWWKSAVGLNYVEKNVASLKRGIKISRIFIVEEIDEVLGDIFKAMQEAGGEIYIAKPSVVPKELHVDFCIVDDIVVWRSSVVDGLSLGNTEITSKDQDVIKALDEFKGLKWYSEVYSSPSVGS